MKKIGKEKSKKSLLILLILSLIFSCISCNNDEEKDGAGYSFTYTLHGNPQNLDPQLATDKSSLMIIKNMFSGLMRYDNEGNLAGNVAVSYDISDDGLKYSFVLRDDCHWYSEDGTEGIVTAHDFVYAFKRIYNPVTQSPYKEKFSFIKNARSIIDGVTDYSQLGVYAINNTELVFELDRPCTEFLYLLTTAPAMPCNKQFFEGTKARYGLDDESVISNGAFYMTQWSYDPYGNDNLIYMKRNYDNTAYDRIYPYMITFVIERDKNEVVENFESEYSDCIVTENRMKKSSFGGYKTQKYQVGSVGIIFNESCGISDNIKKSMAVNLDRAMLQEIVTDNFEVAYGIVPESVNYSDENFTKRDFSDIFETESSDYMISESDIDELYSLYPDGLKILVKNEYDDGLMTQVITHWQDDPGIYIGIDYADSDSYYERLDSGDYIMALVEITSDDNSPYYFLKNVVDTISVTNKETLYTMLDSAFSSSEAGYSDIYNEVESDIISDVSYIPVFYKNNFLTYKNDVKDIIFDAFAQHIDFRYAKYFD
ncbi:MAG: hypothetical protein E7510_02980 [Ruminococcus sp.]|nr:hypothetical protein [Ruminococcus sp.]